jgi:hypothetical protein
LPNRIIYAISDKDKYDVYINKGEFYHIKIKNNSSQPIINSFGFNFVKNNGEKYKKIIENIKEITKNIKKIPTTQNFSKISSIIRNINSKNHKVLFYINGINNIFEKISGDNFDEFIYWGEYNIGKIGNYVKSDLSNSEYIKDIYINGKKIKSNKQINTLIEESSKEKILQKIFYRESGGIYIYKLIFKLLENLNKKIQLKSIEKAIYINNIDNKLFILIKEYYNIVTGDAYDKIIYSFISYIFCDIEYNKFYIFIKPVIKIIDFTDFLIKKDEESSNIIKQKINNYEKNYKNE